MADLDGLEPRRLAAGHPLGGRRPGQGEGGAADPAHAARDALPLPGRRDRPDRRAHRARGRARRRRHPLLAVLQGPRRRAHAHAVDRRARGRLHRAGRAHLAAHGRPGRLQRRGPGGRPRLGARVLPSGRRGARGPARTWPSAPTARCPRPRAPGPSRGATGTTVLLNMSDAAATFDGVARHGDPRHRARAGGTEIEGRSRCRPWSGAVVA